MLGGSVLFELNKNKNFNVLPITRKRLDIANSNFQIGNNILRTILENENPDYIINCAGVISHKINLQDFHSVKNTIIVNSIFPFELMYLSRKYDYTTIQITTDCVFSGQKGKYHESDAKDAFDLYGQSKSLGEPNDEKFINIRCSIVGKEENSATSLMQWFLSQKMNAEVNGYQNRFWNGVTTLAFSKIISGIITEDAKFNGTNHLVPADDVSKFELLKFFAKYFDREDIIINGVDSESCGDFTLRTLYENQNRQLWRIGGYDEPPKIEDLIKEISKF